MRRFLLLSGLLLAMPVAAVAASIETAGDEAIADRLATLGKLPAGNSAGAAVAMPAAAAGRAGNRPALAPGAAAKTVTSVADLAGEWVMTYKTEYATSYDGGGSVTIAAIEGTDSVTVTGFYEADAVVKARVDIAAMAIYIPNQVIGSSSTYGDYDIALYTTAGAIDRTAAIEGTIAADGTITLDSSWGVFGTSGDYTDYCIGIYGSTTLEVPNATMSYKLYDEGDTITCTFGIVATQTATDMIEVKNFYNVGATLYMVLRSDHAAEIDIQTVYTNKYGDWKTWEVSYNSDYSGAYIGSYITCDTATDLRTITWGNWNMICLYNGVKYYPGGVIAIGGEITTTFDISYPEATTLQGDGTAGSPYLVGTAAEWNALAIEYMNLACDSLTGKCVKLTSDLDFTGTYFRQLGYERVTAFDGELDGNGKTISGISVTADATYFGGVVIMAEANSYIHDLTIEGEMLSTVDFAGGVIGAFLYGTLSNLTCNLSINHTNTEQGVVGGIVGYAYGATISDCTYTGTLTSAYLDTGGILGYGDYTTISGCVNRGAVTGRTYTAGIAGQVSYGTMTGCVNEGTITGTSTFTAGVVGYSNYGMTYTNCGNRGAVTCTGTTTASYTAGFAGALYYGTLEYCYNTGTVTAGASSGYLAGLAASCKSGSTSNQFIFTGCYNTADIEGVNYVAGLLLYGYSYNVMTMTDCYNTGNITATGESNSKAYAAGLSMLYYNYSTYTNCHNTGNVTAKSGQYTGGLFSYYRGETTGSSYWAKITGCYNTGDVTSGGDDVGGIVGYMYNYLTIDGCYNTGNITGANRVGGITGHIYANSKASETTNCYNAGDITATECYAGGITGRCDYKDPINNCFNVGNVEATTSSAGGIAGYGAAEIENCYNAGDVTGGTLVGGIVGETKPGNYTSIATAYSSGKIAATAASASAGNIIGAGTDDSSYWNSSNSMSGTYYLTANAVECTDAVSTGLTYAGLASLDLGSGWTAGDDYTYPRITSLADADYARVYAAAIIPADGDTYSNITTRFGIGVPDGVWWDSDPEMISVYNNTAYFADVYTGTLVMTACCGSATASTTLECNVTAEGTATVGNDAKTLIGETLYTTGGARVTEPTDGHKALYIVVRAYNDGTVEAVKQTR